MLSSIESAISNSGDGGSAPADLSARWFGEQVTASRSDAAEMAKWASSTVIDDAHLLNIAREVHDDDPAFGYTEVPPG